MFDPIDELEKLGGGGMPDPDYIEKYLRDSNSTIRRSVVTSRFARVSTLGILNALVDLFGDDYEDIAREAAKAIWESAMKDEKGNVIQAVERLNVAIRSLYTEYEIPSHLSRGQARKGIEYLKNLIPTADAKVKFDNLVSEIWEGNY